MIIDREETGKAIRRWRKEKKLSQAKLAELVNLSPSSIAKYESGENRIPYEVLQKIAAALELAWFEFVWPRDDQMLDDYMTTAEHIFGCAGYEFHTDGENYRIVGHGRHYTINNDALIDLVSKVDSYSKFVIDDYLNSLEAGTNGGQD